jgi:hypothetical protein
MAWNPDAQLPLKNGSISILSVEESAMRLLQEFLAGWFDGGQHIIAGTARKFPAAILTFQEQPLPSPFDGFGIQVVLARNSKVQRRQWAEGKWMITERCAIDFYLRARVKEASPDSVNSAYLVRQGGDLLFALLESIESVKPLLRRGMGVFRPSRPTIVTTSGMPMRHLSLWVNFNYPSESEPSLVAGAPETFTRFKHGRLQLLNDTTNLWHTVYVVGQPATLAMAEEGETWDAAQTEGDYGYRWKDGALQLRNEDTGLWFDLSILGTLPQSGISATGEETLATSLPAAEVTQVWRWKKNVGIQLFNTDTGLWHTLTATGVPSSFSIETTGEP